MSARRWFEDWSVGEQLRYGHYEVTAEELRAFARDFDPGAPEDEEPVAGWALLGAIKIHMIVANPEVIGRSLVSVGFDDLVFHQPARAGDVLSVRKTVVDKRESRSQPDRGVLRFRYEMLNQRDEILMSLISIVFFRRRWKRSGVEA